MLIVAGTLDVAPEQRDDVIAKAASLMRATHQEPGNHEYLFSADPLVSGRIRIFEIWESEEALAEHFGQPHMAEFGAALGAFDVKGNDLTKYQISSSGPLR
jgi:quinol monooxygenase YgiN